MDGPLDSMNLHQEYKIHAESKFGDLVPGQAFSPCPPPDGAGRVFIKLCDRPALDKGREAHYFECGVNAWSFDRDGLYHFPDDAVVYLLDATLHYCFVAGRDA
jgi:hypothetical protein